MTGELADTFSSRMEGVEQLASRRRANSAAPVYAGPAGYVSPRSRTKAYADIASANSHACATLIARPCEHALLI
jgi:uncharacterized hydantoinase/oxoprolinase family protein